MAKVRVPLHGRPQGYVDLDSEATKGATLGENLYRKDGSIVEESDLAPAAAAQGGVAVTIWKLIREIPANIKALAAVTTNGWFRKDGATIVAREIAGSDLPDVADAGGGVLQKTAFDAKGRKTGTSAATTSDLAEGSNLYFTAQRVRDTLLTGLSTATNAVITATDTVLSALGKLQAQISGLITQTITDGDTTHAPSGDAVFDALAGKADDSAAVKLTGNQSVAGEKTFTNRLFVLGARTFFAPNNEVYALGFSYNATRGALGESCYIGATDSANPSLIFSDVAGAQMVVTVPSSAFRPGVDNAYTCGAAAHRWSEVFAANATINTSDSREKTAPRDLNPAELAAAADIARLPSIYQWLHAIEEKGDDARLHCSPTVQAVMRVMKKHGLDPFRYGFVCYDEWDETPELRDGDEVTQEYRPAGNRYSLRPSELAHFVMRGLAHRLDALEMLTEKLTVQ